MIISTISIGIVNEMSRQDQLVPHSTQSVLYFPNIYLVLSVHNSGMKF